MEITIKKKSGRIKVQSSEIEKIIVDQLTMVPGIIRVGEQSFLEWFKSLTRVAQYKPVKVYPIKEGEVGIICRVHMSDRVNFKEVSYGAQQIIKFSIEKKYGLVVNHVDILIEGLTDIK